VLGLAPEAPAAACYIVIVDLRMPLFDRPTLAPLELRSYCLSWLVESPAFVVLLVSLVLLSSAVRKVWSVNDFSVRLYLFANPCADTPSNCCSHQRCWNNSNCCFAYRRLPYKKTEESRTQNFYKPKQNLKPRAGLGSGPAYKLKKTAHNKRASPRKNSTGEKMGTGSVLQDRELIRKSSFFYKAGVYM
jgi:hypothetical protein